jgi:rubredoxin
MSFEKMLIALMGPDWVPPTAEEIAEREARERHEALMNRTFTYYDHLHRRTTRAYSEGRMCEFVYCWKQGRNRTDTDPAGRVLHLLPLEVERGNRISWRAICGTQPGRRSGGWSALNKWDTYDDAPICARCAARLKQMNVLE